MGQVTFGVPEPGSDFLGTRMGLSVFVECGTYLGDTASRMSARFPTVITMERSESMARQARERLEHLANVTLLQGDSRQLLDQVLAEHDNLLLWLDAHWSGGETYGEGDECPLLEELEVIFRHARNCAILIDDARLFLAPPPLPHDLTQWPTLSAILRVLPGGWEMTEFEDVLYLLPAGVTHDFRVFLQDAVTRKWRARKRQTGPARKLLGSLFRFS